MTSLDLDNRRADQRLEELVRQYARLVRSAIGRVAGRHVDRIADDVEQRVYLALWKQVEGEQDIRHPTSYVYRAAVRETVRYLKEEGRRDRHEVAGVEVEPGDPRSLATAREIAEAVDLALGSLSANRSRAVRAHLLGWDVREIMQMNGWTYNTARNLIARGMADLRKRLVRMGFHG